MGIETMMPDRDTGLSPIYARETGVLCDFLDDMYASGALAPKAAYDYYLIARSLVQYLYKRRYNLPCTIREVQINDVTLEDLTSLTEEEWTGYLSCYSFQMKASQNMMSVRICCLRRLYRWLAGKYGCEAPDFVLKEKGLKMEPASFVLVTARMEAEIYKGLQGEFQLRNACMISLALHCGIGLQELLFLTMEDLNRDTIRVRSRSTGRVREIPLQKRTRMMLDRYLTVRLHPIDGENWLFTSRVRKRLSVDAAQKMLMLATKRNPVTFRDLQRTYQQRSAADSFENFQTTIRSGTARYQRILYERSQPREMQINRTPPAMAPAEETVF